MIRQKRSDVRSIVTGGSRRLPRDIKMFIVRQHARFQSPRDIMRLVRDVHGVEVNRLQVLRYNPENSVCVAGKELRGQFERERAAYLSEVEAVPGYHQKCRLVALQELVDDARDEGNKALAAALLMQMAKEVGGMFGSGKKAARKV